MRFIAVFIVLLLLFTVGCTAQPKHELALEVTAKEHQLTEPFGDKFDSAYKRLGINFSEFKALHIAPLDLSRVTIFEQNRSNSSPKLRPWTLTEKDKQYYKLKYEKAAIVHLVDSTLFTLSPNVAESELSLQAAITEIFPVSTKIEQQVGRMKTYSEGFGSMTIELKLFNAKTNELLAIVSDRRDLGNLWERNSRSRDYLHVRNGLNTWLKRLAEAIAE